MYRKLLPCPSRPIPVIRGSIIKTTCRERAFECAMRRSIVARALVVTSRPLALAASIEAVRFLPPTVSKTTSNPNPDVRRSTYASTFSSRKLITSSAPSGVPHRNLRLYRPLQQHSALVNASLIDLLKHLAIVAIVDVNSDKNWTQSIECLFQHRGNLIW